MSPLFSLFARDIYLVCTTALLSDFPVPSNSWKTTILPVELPPLFEVGIHRNTEIKV